MCVCVGGEVEGVCVCVCVCVKEGGVCVCRKGDGGCVCVCCEETLREKSALCVTAHDVHALSHLA